MGGRGVYSFSGGGGRDSGLDEPFVPLVTAHLNQGATARTTKEQALERFRTLTKDEKFEHSALIDSQGFIHALGTSYDEVSTKVAPAHAVRKQKGIVAIVHNHPADNKRKYGGTFSKNDILFLYNRNRLTRGEVKEIHATAPEGIYSARITKGAKLNSTKIASAMDRAREATKGWYSSREKMWMTYHANVAKELSGIGIEATFTPYKSKGKKLVAPEIINN